MCWFPAADAAVVLLFVVLGRRTHDETNAVLDIVGTAAPFLIALGVAWVLLARLGDARAVRSGVIAAAVTVGLGMLLRRLVFDDGTAAAFVMVAVAFNLAGMVGWRMVAARVGRRVFEYGDGH